MLEICMDSAEMEILKALDDALRDGAVATRIDAIVERVQTDLRQNPDKDMAWEPVPLEVYAATLPEIILSSWVFVLRAHTITGAERHPNSHQRMMSYHGSGDFQTRTTEPWQSNFLTSDRLAPLKDRWISIPPNVWHQSAGPTSDWVVVSFHTVEASELIEERPPDELTGKTRQMKYVSDD